MKRERIYLDNAATTPLRTEVGEAMRAVAEDSNFNPSSLHAEGRRAAAVLDDARERVASLLRATRNEIAFTSSGTEADNLALIGTARRAQPGAHLVTTAIEHHAVLGAMDRLRDEGFEITVLPVGASGRVDVDQFAAALRPSTVMASVMYANNEIGTVQPIAELARVARARGVLFHSDAVQAPSWLALETDELHVDLLSLSAHKFGGPKGVGMLYTRRGTPLAPIIHGGGQEFGRRAGTPNVAGIAGLARALELAVLERPEQTARVAGLRDRLERGIVAIDDVQINGAGPRLPNIVNASFDGVESAALLIALDLAGIAVSAGSACASGSLQPSHVLAALGSDGRRHGGAIRFSLGTTTSESDIDRVLAILPAVLAEQRRPVTPHGGMGRV
ncbi:MAG: cysteine desulfurase [Candidatus Eremiobacteraeota bacterium]|nr:cysteine desulfurase [Candidatus Eremiobacteraeota bacterium]